MDQTVWKLAGDSVLLSRTWDGEHVIYHPAAGDTHLLGDAAAQVLALLQTQPANSQTLSAALASYCSPQEQPELVSLTETILSDLETLGLIEQEPYRL